MLRPKYFQKNMLVFITVASVLLCVAEPALAQRANRKSGESSGSEQAKQQAEQERQRQAEQERQRQAEQERQRQAEQERQRQAEQERQRQAEQERQRQAEQERQRQVEQARQQRAEQTRQRQAEQERQRRAEQERQRQVEQARQQRAEQTRQRQAEQERQRQAEQAGQRRQSDRINRKQIDDSLLSLTVNQVDEENNLPIDKEKLVNNVNNHTRPNTTVVAPIIRQPAQERINRKQLIVSPYDGDLELRADDKTSERVNRKLPPLQNNTNYVVVDNSAPAASPKYRYEPSRPSHFVYRDRPYATDTYRHEHIYVDYSSRIRTRTITPGYRFTLCYNRGPRHTFRYFYPYYHRKYVFVSLGGYWPLNYRYIRYYWYGYHPYYWCGYYPIAREVVGSSYNYYTYNYYYDDNPISYQPTGTLESQYDDNIYQQPAEEPAGITQADVYFEEAVRAFEKGNYSLAIEKFAQAMELAPDDMILPFAYSQALFAAQRYTEAAEVLRTVLAKIIPDKEGVFYPRGLYPRDEVLLEQLDTLTEKAELYKFDADLQLLLGYQLLGLGQLDRAVTPLKNASMDLVNEKAAAILLEVLEKIKTTEVQNEDNVTYYIESVITEPETKGVEAQTNLMSEITFDDTQASSIGQNVNDDMKSELKVQDTKTNSPEMEAVFNAKGTTAQLHLTNSAISPIAAEGKITDLVYSTTRQDVILLAVIFVLAVVAGVSWYMSS